MKNFRDTGEDRETAPQQSDSSIRSSDNDEKKSKNSKGAQKSRGRLRLFMQQNLKAVQLSELTKSFIFDG